MSERILAIERAEHWWDENINSPTTTMTNEQWRTNVSVLIRVAEKQARAEVLAACAIAVEEECDKVPGCDSDWPRRIMNVILQLQPAASDLEALLSPLQDEIQRYQSDPNYDNRYLQGQEDMRKHLEALLREERDKHRIEVLYEVRRQLVHARNIHGFDQAKKIFRVEDAASLLWWIDERIKEKARASKGKG